MLSNSMDLPTVCSWCFRRQRDTEPCPPNQSFSAANTNCGFLSFIFAPKITHSLAQTRYQVRRNCEGGFDVMLDTTFSTSTCPLRSRPRRLVTTYGMLNWMKAVRKSAASILSKSFGAVSECFQHHRIDLKVVPDSAVNSGHQ